MCDVAMPDDCILQWGSPALYERARPIEVFDDLVHAQAARLCRKLEAADGAGLAATQVGSPRRMFVFRCSPDHEIDVLVNPRIVWRSHEQELFHEGCLSFLWSWSRCADRLRFGLSATASTAISAGLIARPSGRL